MLVSGVELYLDAGTQKWCYPEHELFPGYIPRLLGHVHMEKELPENFSGLIPEQRATVRVGNISLSDPTISSLRASERLKGKRGVVWVYDTEAATEFLRVDGTIQDVGITQDTATLTIQQRHDAALQKLVPVLSLLDIDPDVDLSKTNSRDIGPIHVFGTIHKVPLHLVRSDDVAEEYDYGLIDNPAFTVLTVDAAYRADRVIPADEYALVIVGDYYVVRFTRPQRTRQGSLEEIKVTLTANEFASHAEVIAWTLKAVGLTVNAASVSAASAVLTGLGIAPAGGVYERRPVLEHLDPLLAVHGITLDTNSDGEYTLTVDTMDAHPVAPISIGHGDEDWYNFTTQSDDEPSLDQDPDFVSIEGLFDYGFSGSGAYRLKVSRALEGTGQPLELTNRFLGDWESLDRVVDHRAKRLQYSARRLTGTVRQSDGRLLRLGARVPAFVPNLFHAGSEWEVCRLSWTGTLSVSVRGFSPLIFAYDPDITQAPPDEIALIDYTRTFPDALVTDSFVIVDQLTRTAGDGSTESVLLVEAEATATANISHIVFRAVRSGSAAYLPEIPVPAQPGEVVQQEIVVLSTLSFDLQAWARNVDNDPDFQDGPISQLLAVTSPTDTTVLSAPTVNSITTNRGANVTVSLAPATEVIFRNFEMWTSTTNDINTATLKTQKAGNTFEVGPFTVGTIYYAWFRKISVSNINGTFTASTAFTPGKISSDQVEGGSASESIKGPPRGFEDTTLNPSTAPNTYGSVSNCNPTSGYSYLSGPSNAVLFSGGTFGVETLTVRLRAEFSDTTEAEVTKTFTAAGQRATLDGDDLFTLQPEGKKAVRFKADAKSDIASSTADGGCRLTAQNYND